MLYWLTTSFIAGIFLGSLLSVTVSTAVLLFVLVGLLTIVSLIRESAVFKIGTCVMLFFVGMWRYQSLQPQEFSEWISSLNDGPEVTLVGQIVADPERVGSVQRLEVGRLSLPASSRRELKGKILVSTYRYPEYHYGDEIQIRGELETPPEFEDFSYRSYLVTQGIYSLINRSEITALSAGNGNRIYTTLINFRRLLEGKIGQILPEPESSLLAGTILGVKRNLPKGFYNALQKSGTLHVIVVSGTNVMYVISGLMWLGGFFTRPLRIFFTISCLLGYALMVGGGAAVWRATLMGLTVLLAAASGRRRLAQEALFLSAAILLLANPMGLWQIGFQLSFAATAGIIFLQGILDQRLQVLPGKIREGLITTLAAQFAVLPIITYNFQTLSVISPLANLLTFLLVPILTVGGAIVVLVALLSLPLGQLVAPLIYIPAKLFVIIVDLSARIPGAQIEIPKVPVVVWVVYYLVLVRLAMINLKSQNSNVKTTSQNRKS